MKIRLVEDWREFHRWASVRAAAILGGLLALYNEVQTFQQYIPPSLFHRLMAALVGLIILFRILDMGKAKDVPK